MEESKDKKLDDLIRKSVREVGLESPAHNFTETLLSKIETVQQGSVTTVYKPLISKVGWGILILVVAGISTFAILGKVDTKLTWLEDMNIEALPKLKFLDALPSMAISNTLLYSLLIFAVFAAIQMMLLKQRLDKRYALQ